MMSGHSVWGSPDNIAYPAYWVNPATYVTTYLGWYMTSIASNDEGTGWFIYDQTNATYVVVKYTTGFINHVYLNNHGNQQDIPHLETSVNISNPKANRAWFAYNGVLFYRDHDVYQCVDMYDCTKVSLEMSISKVSVGRFNSPWIVDTSGNVYYSECSLPRDYWDEYNLWCTIVCPLETRKDTAIKHCTNCKSYNQFQLHNECLVGTSCADIGAINGPSFVDTNDCKCSAPNLYLASTLPTSYSDTPRPTASKCVDCRLYNLTNKDDGLGYGYNICVRCLDINPALPIYDESTDTCIASISACPLYTVPDGTNLRCINCKKTNKIYLSGECQDITTCSDALINAADNPPFNLNQCLCTQPGFLFYYPAGITQYSEVTAPRPKSCVISCNEYLLMSIPDGFGNNKCVSCFDIDSTNPLFDMRTNSCVSTCPKFTKIFPIERYCKDCSPRYYIAGDCYLIRNEPDPANNCLENFIGVPVDNSITGNACECKDPLPYFFPSISAYVIKQLINYN